MPDFVPLVCDGILLCSLPAPLLADVPSADVPTATVPKGPDVPASSQVPPILTSVVDFGGNVYIQKNVSIVIILKAGNVYLCIEMSLGY